MSKKQIIRNKILISLLGLIIVTFLSVLPAQAADLKIKVADSVYRVGDIVTAKIILTSADQSANALSGTLIFPSDKLIVSALDKTGSLINIWTQAPNFSNETNQITFEGVILNSGYQGSAGQILTVTFKAKKAGAVTLAFSRGSVLAGDGQGTAILNNLGQASLTINDNVKIQPPASKPVNPLPPVIPPSPPAIATSTVEIDTTPPIDLFVSEIKDINHRDFTKFNLSATDQSSGLANYILKIDGGAEQKIAGANRQVWQTPKLQAGQHRLLVRAVDRAGNSAELEIDFIITASWLDQWLAYFRVWPKPLIAVLGLFVLILLISLLWLVIPRRRQLASPVFYPPVASSITSPPVRPAEALVVFSGRAYPANDVSVLLAGQILAKTRTGLDGRFEISLSHLPAGHYDFSLTALDNSTRQTTTQIFPMTLTAGVTIRTTDIFLVPSRPDL